MSWPQPPRDMRRVLGRASGPAARGHGRLLEDMARAQRSARGPAPAPPDGAGPWRYTTSVDRADGDVQIDDVPLVGSTAWAKVSLSFTDTAYSYAVGEQLHQMKASALLYEAAGLAGPYPDSAAGLEYVLMLPEAYGADTAYGSCSLMVPMWRLSTDPPTRTVYRSIGVLFSAGPGSVDVVVTVLNQP